MSTLNSLRLGSLTLLLFSACEGPIIDDNTTLAAGASAENIMGEDQVFGRHDDTVDNRMSALIESSPSTATVIQPVPASSDFGQPIAGLTSDQLARFNTGAATFNEVETVADGLGPIFNGNSCGGCHEQPALGGGADFAESRFGRVAADGTFDPLADEGGTLQQFFSIGAESAPMPGCTFPDENIPADANVRTLRRSNPLFGAGLVNNVPEGELRALATLEGIITPATAGHVAISINLSTQTPLVSRFGWKAQVPTVFQFAGNAYVNEMGITNPQFPIENCPNMAPDCDLVHRCNPKPGLNDDGTDVQAFTDFMSFLGPPPRGPITDSVRRGQTTFTLIGCANCHTPTLVTGSSDVAALSDKIFHPYSDFLLHDMGSDGDGIGPDQGDATMITVIATPTELRTAPLWGVRGNGRFLHDMRARTIQEAILVGHEGQGAGPRARFQHLSAQQQQDLVAFVNSL